MNNYTIKDDSKYSLTISLPEWKIISTEWNHGDIGVKITTPLTHQEILIKYDKHVKRFYCSTTDNWIDLPRKFYYEVLEAIDEFLYQQ